MPEGLREPHRQLWTRVVFSLRVQQDQGRRLLCKPSCDPSVAVSDEDSSKRKQYVQQIGEARRRVCDFIVQHPNTVGDSDESDCWHTGPHGTLLAASFGPQGRPLVGFGESPNLCCNYACEARSGLVKWEAILDLHCESEKCWHNLKLPDMAENMRESSSGHRRSTEVGVTRTTIECCHETSSPARRSAKTST